MAWLNVTPWALVASFKTFIERLLAHGLDAIRDLGEYFLLGAVIVVPIWLVIRLAKAAPVGRR